MGGGGPEIQKHAFLTVHVTLTCKQIYQKNRLCKIFQGHREDDCFLTLLQSLGSTVLTLINPNFKQKTQEVTSTVL